MININLINPGTGNLTFRSRSPLLKVKDELNKKLFITTRTIV